MKYIIRWESGTGEKYDEVEADSKIFAQNMAYQRWIDDADPDKICSVVGESTEELRDELL